MHVPEQHYTHRIGWLRAAVLGANDGIISTASIIIGVAAAEVTHSNILIAGLAGLVAGAMSMAAGEYVSVSSQSDIESADLEREKREHENNIDFERNELAELYVKRGVQTDLAKQVAEQLMEHDAIGAHAREELGISEIFKARPIQAALTSAGTFTIGALVPLLIAMAVSENIIIPSVSVSTLLSLVLLGGIAAKTAGAPLFASVVRVLFWGALAMGITAGVGKLLGVSL